VATASERVSRWTRGFVAASACWLVVWQAAALWGVPRRAALHLALPGFLLHVVFGKAYSLVPSYFERSLAVPRAPALHLPLAVGGVAALALGRVADAPGAVTAGATAWAAGVAVFLGTLLWTVRDNLTGAATGTGDHRADRRAVDRAANAAVPVALGYLAAGTWLLVAARTPLPAPLAGYPARVSHLLAVGTAALLLFAVGFRALPRFLVAHPPRPLVWVVLACGAVGPGLLAVGLPDGPLLVAGAALVAAAVVGFAAAYAALFVRSDRSRVGFAGVLLGAVAGVGTVALGLYFALAGADPSLVTAHYRLGLLGFLGLSVVGVSYQFYPPGVARFPLAGDRLAVAVYAALGGGLLAQVVAATTDRPVLGDVGRALALLGALLHAYLLLGLFAQRKFR
jgi:hypothetical protein